MAQVVIVITDVGDNLVEIKTQQSFDASKKFTPALHMTSDLLTFAGRWVKERERGKHDAHSKADSVKPE